MLKEILLDAFDLSNQKGNKIKEEENEWEWIKLREERVRKRVH